jgi:hypothetical protein
MMDLFWLAIVALVIAALYARYWYHRPSNMPQILVASYAYQTIEFLYDTRPAGTDDIQRYEISETTILKPLPQRS